MKKQNKLQQLPFKSMNITPQSILLSFLMAFLISCGWSNRPCNAKIDGSCGTTDRGPFVYPIEPSQNPEAPETTTSPNSLTQPSADTDGQDSGGNTQLTPPSPSLSGGNTPPSPNTAGAAPHTSAANTPSPVTSADPDDTPADPSVSFKNNIKPLLQTHCVSCHDNPQMAGAFPQIDWLDYDTAINLKDDLLARVWELRNDPAKGMPLGNQQQMSEEERITVKNWVESI